MLNKYLKIILFVWLNILLITPQVVLAVIQEISLNESSNSAIKKLYQIGVEKGPYSAQSETGISTITGAVVEAVLVLVGVIFLVLMIYAGYNWMTARGEEEKVEKAKDTITRAFIGLIIVVGAYAIWSFVFNQFILK
jgi:lysylphosphatidylglycerol synthetase-like protein (DUF2156 family)